MNQKNPVTKLFIIFAALYFVQGMGELTAGLLAQPLRSMLRNWGKDTGEIATFMFVLGIPWFIKPLFGLMTDFVPIRGLRRKSYLILASSLMVGGFVIALFLPLDPAYSMLIFSVLFIPNFGIAFKDVATDATMIETGQPLGLTGRLQSAQWAAIYTAGLLTGVIGGWIAQQGYQKLGFAMCGALGLISLYIGIFQIKEEPRYELQKEKFKRAVKVLGQAARSRIVILVAVFTFLVNFNPFSADVLYIHMSNQLGFSEQFVGYTYTIGSFAAIGAAVLYGLFAKHVSLRLLLHGSVIFMIFSKLVYLGMDNQTAAVIASLANGFFYMVTTLTQLELAGRFCPPEAAGTVFALLMSFANLSVSLSSVVGGSLYEKWNLSMGVDTSYTMLVLIASGVTALCWLMLWWFPKEEKGNSALVAEAST